MKRTTVSIVAVLVISLAIWTAYSRTSYPLDAGSTLVVVGIVGLVVAGIQWIIAKLNTKGTNDDTTEKTEKHD
jgi:hypothetical protein